MVSKEHITSQREFQRVGPTERKLWEVAEKLSLSKEHFSSSQRETLAVAASGVEAHNLSNPESWSTESTLLYFSYVDAYIASGRSSAYPIMFLIDEIGLNEDRRKQDTGRLPQSADVYKSHYSSQGFKDPKLRTYYSPLRTKRLKEEFFDAWGFRSPLRKTRKKFDVTKDTELPFDLVVTILKTADFQNVFNCSAFVRTRANVKMIVIPNDSSENTKIHEYIHSQWNGLSSGTHYGLYRGIDEAYVEDSTPHPQAYPSQRDVLYELDYSIPGFKEKVKAAGIHPDARDDMLQSVLRTFGLSGIHTVSRFSPTHEVDDKFYSQRQKNIFIPIKAAHRSLRVLQ